MQKVLLDSVGLDVFLGFVFTLLLSVLVEFGDQKRKPWSFIRAALCNHLMSFGGGLAEGRLGESVDLGQRAR